MGIVVQQAPVQGCRLVPLDPLRQFPAHEQELLAGVRRLPAEQQAQVGELLPRVARHLV